ncbi:hypothetical protein BSPLISOX_1449 [uncultured Gammaproteobacteria bacterium]|nr:hypothetical protein BSPLISOX_1449 [uncultured Gammaproteobacteria bacterium]
MQQSLKKEKKGTLPFEKKGTLPFYPKSKNRTTQTPNPQSKPKKCTPFKPCLQQNTGIFSEFRKKGTLPFYRKNITPPSH